MANVLVIAPHADDETLGCGGVMARLALEGHRVCVGVVTGNGPGKHPLFGPENFEIVRGELRDACKVLGVAEIFFEEIPTVFVKDQPLPVLNDAIKRLIENAKPEIVFAPFPYDMHRDHREIYQAAAVAWRPYLATGHAIKEVYCYEVQSETHLNVPYVEAGFLPNVHWDISGEPLRRKLAAFACFKSQIQDPPMPRSLKALEALATWRGSQIGVEAAEGFVLVRALR
jgi:N-acetylglucosamine malate deacetylase 1